MQQYRLYYNVTVSIILSNNNNIYTFVTIDFVKEAALTSVVADVIKQHILVGLFVCTVSVRTRLLRLDFPLGITLLRH